MVELEVAAFGAPAPILRDVPALPALALPRLSLDVRGDVPGTRLRAGARPRLRGGRELPLLDLSQEQRERASKDGAGIAVRDLPAEQVLEASELSLGLCADRELYAVTFWRERSDHRP